MEPSSSTQQFERAPALHSHRLLDAQMRSLDGNGEAPPIHLTFERAAALQGHGPFDARMARMAARRAFVEMKQCFMRAAAEIVGSEGRTLQREIRQSTELTELWRLQGTLLSALAGNALPTGLRHELREHMDSAFPDPSEDTVFTPF